MMELNPGGMGGRPYNSWALYYAGAPRILGGNLKKAAMFFNKAVQAGPDKTYMLHDRASVLHVKTGDKNAFINDMTIVATTDPHNVDDPYPWNVFFQRSAKSALTKIQDHF